MTTPEQPPEWALKRAIDELNGEHRTPADPFSFWKYADAKNDPIVRTVARLIAKHEPAPVDPVLAAAREAAAQWYENCHCPKFATEIRAGDSDDDNNVRTAIAAINLYLANEASK